MIVSDAQRDITRAYVGGGPGLFFSSLVWVAAGFAQQTRGTGYGFAVLFVGGMLIYPAGVALSRIVFRRAAEAKENPLGLTAIESTVCMIGGLIAAWLMLPLKPALVFPLAALAVGTHFAVFKTVYGDRLFWVLGALLTALASYAIFSGAPVAYFPFLAAAIEAVFGVLLTVRALVAK